MRLVRLLAVFTLVLGAVVLARATDVPIVGLKLIVIDKGSGGNAKAVFVAKDVAITKGSGTDPLQIEAKLEVEYDDASGAFLMPQGSNWTANKTNVGKYGNKTAPAGGVVKVGLIKPGTLLKLVGRGVGDTPLDISSAPTGDVYVAATIVNGGEETRLCTRFSGCTHKSIAGGTGFKLLCKGSSTGDPTCNAAAARCATAPAAPVGGSYATCTTDIASGTTCALTCGDGYSHTGTDPICTDGSFAGDATCVPATCAPLAEPLTSSDCATAPTGSTCTVQCAAGAHRSDGGVDTSVVATCTGTAPGAASWTHSTFTCEADPCPTAPIAPVGGSYSSCTTNIPSGTTCALTCADGYSRVGTTDPTCQSGAFVSGDATCAPASCAPLTEPFTSSDCAMANTGSSCTVQCAPGMQRSDGGVGTSVTATCTGTGPGAATWTHPTFTCAPPPCTSAPAAVTGGSYPGCATPPIASGTTCTLACADGYSHVGTDPTCESGAFVGSATCTPASCAPIVGSTLNTNCATGALGNTCNVQCAPGHYRSDGGVGTSVTATCTGTAPGVASWTHPTFTCEPNPCTGPPSPIAVGGSYPTCMGVVPSGQTCPLACADGYTHTGIDPSCYLGSFNGSTNDCLPATCAPLSELNIASNCGADPTGSTCTVQCTPLHHRTDGGVGSSVTGTCTGTAPGVSSWTHPTFTCEPNPCMGPPAPIPAGGSYPTCTGVVPSGQTCPLACANGYTHTGTDPSCYLGSFNGSTNDCLPATCAPLNEPYTASNCGTGTTGGVCTVQCLPGHHRTDGGSGFSVTATCTGTAPGVSAWTHPTFTCEPDQCVGPPMPIAVGGSYPTCMGLVPSGQTCPLACADGYTHTGTDPSCYLGFFNGGTNDCAPATCAPLASPPPHTFPNTQNNCGAAPTGSTCTVQCVPGYIRSDGGGGPTSTVNATCTGTGVGTSEWVHPTFTCIGQPCLSAPAPVVGGSFATCTTPPIASGTDCPLTCADGYTNVGSPHVTCFLGNYNGTASCMPNSMTGTFGNFALSQPVAPAAPSSPDAAGLDGAAQLITLIAAVQIIRRRFQR